MTLYQVTSNGSALTDMCRCCFWRLPRVVSVGMLTALHGWEEANNGITFPGGKQQLSILHELAASEMCPMRALEYAATLDWSSAKPSLGAIDPARVAQFQSFVQQVKVSQQQYGAVSGPLHPCLSGVTALYDSATRSVRLHVLCSTFRCGPLMLQLGSQ